MRIFNLSTNKVNLTEDRFGLPNLGNENFQLRLAKVTKESGLRNESIARGLIAYVHDEKTGEYFLFAPERKEELNEIQIGAEIHGIKIKSIKWCCTADRPKILAQSDIAQAEKTLSKVESKSESKETKVDKVSQVAFPKAAFEAAKKAVQEAIGKAEKTAEDYAKYGLSTGRDLLDFLNSINKVENFNISIDKLKELQAPYQENGYGIRDIIKAFLNPLYNFLFQCSFVKYWGFFSDFQKMGGEISQENSKKVFSEIHLVNKDEQEIYFKFALVFSRNQFDILQLVEDPKAIYAYMRVAVLTALRLVTPNSEEENFRDQAKIFIGRCSRKLTIPVDLVVDFLVDDLAENKALEEFVEPYFSHVLKNYSQLSPAAKDKLGQWVISNKAKSLSIRRYHHENGEVTGDVMKFLRGKEFLMIKSHHGESIIADACRFLKSQSQEVNLDRWRMENFLKFLLDLIINLDNKVASLVITEKATHFFAEMLKQTPYTNPAGTVVKTAAGEVKGDSKGDAKTAVVQKADNLSNTKKVIAAYKELDKNLHFSEMKPSVAVAVKQGAYLAFKKVLAEEKDTTQLLAALKVITEPSDFLFSNHKIDLYQWVETKAIANNKAISATFTDQKSETKETDLQVQKKIKNLVTSVKNIVMAKINLRELDKEERDKEKLTKKDKALDILLTAVNDMPFNIERVKEAYTAAKRDIKSADSMFRILDCDTLDQLAVLENLEAIGTELRYI